MKRVKTLCLFTLVILALFNAGAVKYAQADPATGPQIWDKEIITLVSTLPLQENGRVKPLYTYANFKLLRYSGKRKISLPKSDNVDETISMDGVSWLMDVLFRPEAARKYAVLRVENSEVLKILNLPEKNKRDYYSYDDIFQASSLLEGKAQEFMKVKAENRSAAQRQTLLLYENFLDLHYLLHALDCYRNMPTLRKDGRLAEIFADEQGLSFSAILRKLPRISMESAQLMAAGDGHESEAIKALREEFSEFDHWIETTHENAKVFSLIPLAGPLQKEPRWVEPGRMMEIVARHGPNAAETLQIVEAMDFWVRNGNYPAGFLESLRSYHAKVVGAANSRGEYAKVVMEYNFYKQKPFGRALIFFVIAFVICAASWLMPNAKWMRKLCWGAALLPLCLLVYGIAYRCVLRGRPPVTTLYETTLFITAVSMLVALFLEWANRRGIALSTAVTLGMAGMFLANRYESKDGLDTMENMQAVLDSNFWLSTHVTCISIGYAAGLLAAAMAHVYIGAKILSSRMTPPLLRLNPPQDFFNALTRMVYGVLCFTMLFAFVGTVLGGIWANESWGRFWGWDPKENGALLIVLCTLSILHGRLGGYVREFGIHAASIFLGMVVAFSWWGVNLLGIGLHSYGWISGIAYNLAIFYALEILILCAGFWVRFSKSEPKSTNELGGGQDISSKSNSKAQSKDILQQQK